MTDRKKLMMEGLQARARLLADLRGFFSERGILEVETPALAPTTGTDPHIDSFAVPVHHLPEPRDYYLQTSPEFAMKRLLALGSGPIYQISKVFRAGESSRLHNPEFTMLEWYRPHFTMEQLMDETADLLTAALSTPESKAAPPKTIPRLSYKQLFQQHLNLNPHTATPEQVAEAAHRTTDINTPLDKTAYLQRLMALIIEPNLPDFCFIYNYPVEQCALATIEPDADGTPVARRFELYAFGVELANGYQELTDPTEQRRRFQADLTHRRTQARPLYPLDENLLAALSAIPPTAGIALGLDRLLMLITNAETIADVLTFTTDDC